MITYRRSTSTMHAILSSLVQQYGLSQHVTDPTHTGTRGHIFDIVITWDETQLISCKKTSPCVDDVQTIVSVDLKGIYCVLQILKSSTQIMENCLRKTQSKRPHRLSFRIWFILKPYDGFNCWYLSNYSR